MLKRLYKPAIVLYFLILYAIIASYIYHANLHVSLRFNVAATEQLSARHPNLIAFWAHEDDRNYDFSGWIVEADIEDSKGNIIGRQKAALPHDGHTLLQMSIHPVLPPGEMWAHIRLSNPKGQLQNQAKLRFISTQTPFCPIGEPSPLDIELPGALLLETPGDVLLSFGKSEPYVGPVHTDISYGRALLPSALHTHPVGLLRLPLILESPADIGFMTDDDTIVYATFIPNERALNLVAGPPLLTPQAPLSLTIQTIAGENDVTLDFFDQTAWIGRSKVRTDSHTPIALAPDIAFDPAPQIVRLQACLLSWECRQNAQQTAIIVSQDPMSPLEQAQFALQQALSLCPKAPFAKRLLHLQQALSTLPLSDDDITLIRDYALAKLSATHTPQIAVRIRTEDIDKASLQAAKDSHKTSANYLLAGVIFVGILIFGLIVLRQRPRPVYFDEDDELALDQSKRIEKLHAFVHIAILILVFIATIAGIFYLLQIL